jgi:small subunit ribosomal protein S3
MIERTFVKKNFNKMDLDNYLSKKLSRAGYSNLEIIKTPLVTRIVLHVAKPGMAIGKSGSTIKELTEKIAKDFEIDNPQIEIQEVKKPNLNAKIVVEKMASMIDRGFSWRSVAFRTVRDIMGSGAQGVELVFKGALGGKGARKRKQRIALGYMKKIGDQAKYVDSAKAAANPKCGAIGIKLSIIHPDIVFPDKIDVNEVISGMKIVKEEKEEQEKAETKNEDKKETNKEEKTKKTEGKKEQNKETKEVKEEKAKDKKDEKSEKELVKKIKEKKKEIKKETEKESLINKAAEEVEEIIEEVEEVAGKIVKGIEKTIEGKGKEKKEEPKKEESSIEQKRR